jgi:hypothetical protein
VGGQGPGGHSPAIRPCGGVCEQDFQGVMCVGFSFSAQWYRYSITAHEHSAASIHKPTHSIASQHNVYNNNSKGTLCKTRRDKK